MTKDNIIHVPFTEEQKQARSLQIMKEIRAIQESDDFFTTENVRRVIDLYKEYHRLTKERGRPT